MATKSFVFVCLFAATVIGVSADEPEKLMQGTRARDGEFPYMVAIFNNGNFHCGGAIVREDLILTAAHCVDPFIQNPNSNVHILTGTNNLKVGGEYHVPSKYFKHSKWSSATSWSYDVGMIKLATPIKTNAKQQVVQISKVPPPPPGSNVIVSAWGLNGYPHGVIPDNMDKLQLSTMSSAQCQQYHDYPISELQICTYKAPGVGTCQGDSGSPLAYNGKVIGVVSGGIPCATGVPDVFTNLYYVQDFIDAVFRDV